MTTTPATKRGAIHEPDHTDGHGNLQRPPAKARFAEEPTGLGAEDGGPRPPGWELSLRAARRLVVVVGDENAGVIREFVGNTSLVERALVTLATNRGLILVGEPGTQ